MNRKIIVVGTILGTMFSGLAEDFYLRSGNADWSQKESFAMNAALTTGNALLGSGLPLHIGQDGTGSFKWNRSCYLDDIAVWKRSLTTMEIRSIYLAGREGRQLKGLLEKSKNTR
jgi:hypothetical protein